MLENLDWKKNSKVTVIFKSFKERLNEIQRYHPPPFWRYYRPSFPSFSINGLIVEASDSYRIRMPVFNFLDEIMPPQMFGAVEIKIERSVNEWEGEIEIRWIVYK